MTNEQSGRIVLADPRGFCAGVDRAILTVQTILRSAADAERARAAGLPPVYVRRQIVHNRHVVEDLSAQGAVFVQELDEIPDEGRGRRHSGGVLRARRLPGDQGRSGAPRHACGGCHLPAGQQGPP